MMWDFPISVWVSHPRQLSGGEAQRIKLATELSRTQYRKDQFIFWMSLLQDLHFADVHKLTEILHRLSDGRQYSRSSLNIIWM